MEFLMAVLERQQRRPTGDPALHGNVGEMRGTRVPPQSISGEAEKLHGIELPLGGRFVADDLVAAAEAQ
jgi:hypothetical protein